MHNFKTYTGYYRIVGEEQKKLLGLLRGLLPF